MIKVQLLATLFFFSNNFFAKSQPIMWQKTIGTIEQEYTPQIISVPTGGYLLVSGVGNPISPQQDIYGVRMGDDNGSIMWQKKYGGNKTDGFSAVKATSDGGFIICGGSNSDISGDKSQPSYNGQMDYWILKLDVFGNKQWDKTLGGSGYDAATDIAETADGAYIVVGMSLSPASFDKTQDNRGFVNGSTKSDLWILKINNRGGVLWQRTIGGYDSESNAIIKCTRDTSAIIVCQTSSQMSYDITSPSRGEIDFWVVKLNKDGETQWDKRLGSPGIDIPHSLELTPDGGYIIGGESKSFSIGGDRTQSSRGGNDYWVVKVDSMNNKEWDKCYGGYSDDELHDIKKTVDGGYILTGESRSELSGDKTIDAYDFDIDDYWVIKVNRRGEIQWQKIFGGASKDASYSLIQDTEGNFVIAGMSNSNISFDKTENCLGNFDIWVLKVSNVTTSTDEVKEQILNIYPNPSNGIFTIKTNYFKILKINVYNIFGQLVYEQIGNSNELNIVNLLEGTYIIECVTDNDAIMYKKIIKYK